MGTISDENRGEMRLPFIYLGSIFASDKMMVSSNTTISGAR